MTEAELAELDGIIDRALAEDVGDGDRTTEWTVPPDAVCEAVIVAKRPLALAGVEAASRVFQRVDGRLRVEECGAEGDAIEAGEPVMAVSGPTRPLLSGERTALNFLARLSGIATLTRAFVSRVDGTGALIVDTRKTTPGWRLLEKMAVRAGGGTNHRMGLHDMVLIKDNHIAAAGGVGAALRAVHERNTGLPVEVEVRSEGELREALAAGVNRVLLDNMSLAQLAGAVDLARMTSATVELEASGNVTLETALAVAQTGVDLISVGALTHSAPAADLSLRIVG